MAARVEHIGEATLYLGDCLDILPTLPKVDMVVTSPPYGQQRDYGNIVKDWRRLVSGALLATQIERDAQVLINLGLIYKNGECVEYWDGLKNDMRRVGFRLFGWYVWDKGFGLPGSWGGRLAPAHEFIFHFNRDAVAARKWVRTQDRGKSGTGRREANGTIRGRLSEEACGQPYKVPDSVFRSPPLMSRGQIENAHPAVFPVLLPAHFIQTFSDAGDTILDPFMGSGTTGVACAKLGRKFIGVEIHEPYFDIACRRIEEAYRQPNLFAEPRPKATQDNLFGRPS
jgi:DNA modification methylase